MKTLRPASVAICILGATGCATVDGVGYERDDGTIVVNTPTYFAVLDASSGELSEVYERTPDGSRASRLVREDRITLQIAGIEDEIDYANMQSGGVRFEEVQDFYLRISGSARVSTPQGDVSITRTYEFTRSPHIYEQVSVASDASGEEVSLRHLEWTVVPESERTEINVLTTSDDLFVDAPNGPFGGTDVHLPGEHWRTEFGSGTSRSRLLAADGQFGGEGPAANLSPGKVYFANSLISLGGSQDSLPTSKQLAAVQYQFYPGLGIRGRRQSATRISFTNWNNFAHLNRFVPVRSSLDEDYLIRAGLHFVRRMEADDGWPSWSAWSVFPDGDRFTAHSRSFPHLAYLWGHLALKREGDTWIYRSGDADVFYDVLQSTYPYFLQRSGPNFEDSSPEGVPYISYSASLKERENDARNIRGVLNTHAHAMHFAWLMREISLLRGNQAHADRWEGVISRYHSGSKALFADLYPGQTGGENDRRIGGTVNYSRGRSSIHPGQFSVAYNTISFEGIAAGYLLLQETEAAFIEAVNHASHGDYDPYDREAENASTQPFVARLCRVYPPALALAGKTLSMSGSISAAGVRETLLFGEYLRGSGNDNASMGRHDPDLYIVEGNGRKLILTNHTFTSEWVRGHWEEKPLDAIDDADRFNVVVSPANGDGGLWSAFRSGNSVEFMSDTAGNGVLLRLPGSQPLDYRVSYRDYEPENFDWSPWHESHNGVTTGGGLEQEVRLGEVPARRIVRVEFPDR